MEISKILVTRSTFYNNKVSGVKIQTHELLIEMKASGEMERRKPLSVRSLRLALAGDRACHLIYPTLMNFTEQCTTQRHFLGSNRVALSALPGYYLVLFQINPRYVPIRQTNEVYIRANSHFRTHAIYASSLIKKQNISFTE